jgi:hypothetical protein
MGGSIDRRLLVNATVPLGVLPTGLRAADVGGPGRALVGVCVVRTSLRPCRLPGALAPRFEGLAYRVATVEPDGRPGVAVVRRETADRRAILANRLGFPLDHHLVALRTDGDLAVTVAPGGGGHGPALVLDLVAADPAGTSGPGSVLGDAADAAAFFGAATTATETDGASFELTSRPFALTPLVPRPGTTLVLDRLAWAFGLPPEAVTFDSAFVARDVPVRLRATAPTAQTAA